MDLKLMQYFDLLLQWKTLMQSSKILSHNRCLLQCPYDHVAGDCYKEGVAGDCYKEEQSSINKCSKQ